MRWRLVIADGFNDFTRTQHEILETLAGCWTSLGFRSRRSPSRGAATVPEAPGDAGRAPAASSGHDGRRARPAGAALVGRRWLTWSGSSSSTPGHATPADYALGIEILAAGRQLGEIELIVARIKRLLAEGDGAGRRPVRPSRSRSSFGSRTMSASWSARSSAGWESRLPETGRPLIARPCW